MKKYILFVFLTIFLISCKNAEVVRNENTRYFEIEEKLKVWNLEEAEELLNTLDEEGTKKYTQIINEKKSKLENLYFLEGIIKDAFYSGDFTLLDKHMKLGSIESFKYEKMKEYGVNSIRVYIGSREFLNDDLTEIAVMNLYEESIYIELSLQFEGDDWFIKSFDEKR